MKNILVWADEGEAGDLTDTFAGDIWVPITDEFNTMLVDVLLVNEVDPTTLEMQILVSPDGGETEWGPLDAVQEITNAGEVVTWDAVFQHFSTTDGHHTFTIRGLIHGLAYCVQLRITGGTNVTAIAYAAFGRT